MSESLLLQVPGVAAPLHPEFRPAALAIRAFREATQAAGGGERVVLGIERVGGLARFETSVLPADHPAAGENYRFVERIVKMLLWQKGGFRVWISGPKSVADQLAEEYSSTGARAFDADFMAKVYEKPAFEVKHVSEAEVPAEREEPEPVGGHLDGCRIAGRGRAGSHGRQRRDHPRLWVECARGRRGMDGG